MKRVAAILFFAVVGAILYFRDKVPETFLPDEDKGTITMNIELAQGGDAGTDERRLRRNL